MIDPSDMEQAAMRACLSPLGDCVASIGMQRPLADYRREEVLALVEVVVTTYQEAIAAEHERLAEKERAHFDALMNSKPIRNAKEAPF